MLSNSGTVSNLRRLKAEFEAQWPRRDAVPPPLEMETPPAVVTCLPGCTCHAVTWRCDHLPVCAHRAACVVRHRGSL